MTYKYITENNLEHKQTYMYSEFGGNEFLKAYIKSRQDFIENVTVEVEGVHKAYIELDTCKRTLLNENEDYVSAKKVLDYYVKSFEVRKRLYTEYTLEWKPVNNAGYEFFEVYLLFSECLFHLWKKTNCTKYSSCLLKLHDTLLSVANKMTEYEKEELKKCLENELKMIKEIAAGQGVCLEESV